VAGETRLLEVTPEGVTDHTVSPERVGLERADLAQVKGGTPEQNAETARSVLGGEPGPRRSLVVLNAGAALFVAERVSSFEEGVRLAEQTVDSGQALAAMESFVSKTRELAPEEEPVGRAG
jgi:anthranilate phosphoribosyltransferase